MINLSLVIMLLLTFTNSPAQQKFVPVFESGKQGYNSYRIPAIIRLPNGDLLAFCEGRVKDAGDFGNIDIVMKSSRDKGKNWGPMQVVADAAEVQAGNPAPVVDLSDPAYPKGRIFLFYNTGNNHENEVRKGHGLREAWYITSIDNGLTWSVPVNITTQVHRPKQPAVNKDYDFPDDWRSYANTPGHAMQFQSGRYKGRIYIAANHSAGDPQQQSVDYKAHGYYTDDHGKSFQLGATINLPGSNESTAAELSGNRLLVNSRNQRGDIKSRIISISSDGGSSWDTTYFDPNLPDPVNEGSLLNIGSKAGKAVLAFTNAADTAHRNKLTLRISDDEGQSWKRSWLVYAGDAANDAVDYAAYSDLVQTGKKEIGILFEKDDYTSIVFTTISWK
ncbi:sialidase family protein [Flavihumibacter fluvii]|uniref:sialidase family protein n=1 Tax=Flavihumibacter fluvii TaxID=2838157 RepID=UPI001BDEFBAE|nr:sialidase family protein [Flavihumibacter fluvii]ULQ52067.1 glycoside hydrolase [Flavihumibacter fluvii]